MSDPHAGLAGQDSALQERIADAMDARCPEPAQVEIRQGYLGDLDLADAAIAVELGSGTGRWALNQRLSWLIARKPLEAAS